MAIQGEKCLGSKWDPLCQPMASREFQASMVQGAADSIILYPAIEFGLGLRARM